MVSGGSVDVFVSEQYHDQCSHEVRGRDSALKAKGEVRFSFEVFSREAGSEGFSSLANFSCSLVGAKPTAVSALQLRSNVSMSSVMDLIRSCQLWRAPMHPICAIMKSM